MANIYLQNNVFEESLERLRFLFDTHDDVIVSMSGGKDSTVLFELALMVAKEKNRLPLKVFWLDQEAEWQGTVDYMKGVMYRDEVKPYWYQIPFDFPNSLSTKKDFIRIWDRENESEFIHPIDKIAITENPTKENLFHQIIQAIPNTITSGENCAVLVGMRITESLNRRMVIAHGSAKFRGITWAGNKKDKCQIFWPIYDWIDDDIWTAIGKFGWEYNKIYDKMYQFGVPKSKMRISALIHETSWHSIEYSTSLNLIHTIDS
jgi:predicted phosphoadenosine phosphosulfate sulfurtransferase